MNTAIFRRAKADLSDAADTMRLESERAAARARDMAQDASDKARSTTDSAIREVTDLANTLNAKLRALGVPTDRIADSVTTNGQALMESALDLSKEGLSSLETVLRKEIRERPGRSLMVAAIAGIAIGLMTRR